MALWPFSRHDPSSFLPEPAQDTPDTPPAPKYVSEESFTQAMSQVQGLNSKLDQMAGLMAGLLGGGGSPTPPPPAPSQELPIPDITEAEYQDALLKGDGAQVAIRMNAVAERKARELRREYDQRFQTLERQGMAVLESVSTDVTQQSLSAMPYYQVFKQDIDAALKQLPVHQRTPEMRAHIYHATLGANLDKVRAHDAAEATRITKEREQLDPPGRTRERDAGPTPENVFGDKLMSNSAAWMGGGPLWAKRSKDEWARNRYQVKDIQEASVYATNVMALDNCSRCFGPIIGGKCHCRGQR